METEKKEKLPMPARKIAVKIGMNEYALNMPLKNGDEIDIEALKIRMTGGTLKDLAFGGPASMNAYVTVEAIATFEILIPQLKTDLTVKSLTELDALQFKPVLKAYEGFYKLAAEWRAFLNQDVDEVEEDK